jgi:hypothetical protein
MDLDAGLGGFIGRPLYSRFVKLGTGTQFGGILSPSGMPGMESLGFRLRVGKFYVLIGNRRPKNHLFVFGLGAILSPPLATPGSRLNPWRAA